MYYSVLSFGTQCEEMMGILECEDHQGESCQHEVQSSTDGGKKVLMLSWKGIEKSNPVPCNSGRSVVHHPAVVSIF
jgi:hypothetical protein